VAWPSTLGGKHYKLAGIQERHLGDTLPGFDGFFQYRVGDQYYWVTLDSKNSWPFPTTIHWLTKITITSVQRDSLGLHLGYDLVGRIYYSDILRGEGQIASGVWNILDQKAGLVTRSHWEQISFAYLLKPYSPPFWPPMSINGNTSQFTFDQCWSAATYFKPDSILKLRLGNSVGNNYFGVYLQATPTSTVANPITFMRQSAEFTQGLGITLQASSGFEMGSYYKMVGHIIDGDTVGTIWEDSYLLGQTATQPTVAWEIYPNPAHEPAFGFST
jgi:hypothetical protein